MAWPRMLVLEVSAMWLDVIARPLPAQTGGFGPGDWVALGLVLALFLAAFVVPNVVASRATGRGAHRPVTAAHGRATGTAA
jgi:hypothetical protein